MAYKKKREKTVKNSSPSEPFTMAEHCITYFLPTMERVQLFFVSPNFIAGAHLTDTYIWHLFSLP